MDWANRSHPRAGQPSIVAMLHNGSADYRRRFRHLVEAPGTVLLGLGRFFEADDNRETSRNEKQKASRTVGRKPLDFHSVSVHELIATVR
jgi:hypothetical protein